jgi:hypothetical protein
MTCDTIVASRTTVAKMRSGTPVPVPGRLPESSGQVVGLAHHDSGAGARQIERQRASAY